MNMKINGDGGNRFSSPGTVIRTALAALGSATVFLLMYGFVLNGLGSRLLLSVLVMWAVMTFLGILLQARPAGRKARAGTAPEKAAPSRDACCVQQEPAERDASAEAVYSLNNIFKLFEEFRACSEDNDCSVPAAQARLEHLLKSNPGVIFSCRPSPPWEPTYVSAAVRSLIGIAAETLIGGRRGWLDLIHPEDRADVADRLARLPETGSDISEYRMRNTDGDYVWIRDEMRVDYDAEGAPREFIGYWVDITSYKSLEQQLIFDAFHDTLTKLPNRALFLDRLHVSFAKLKRYPGHLFGIMFVDIDRFKNINEAMGSEAGDLVLQAAASRLLGCVRFGDTVSRWSGDEFAVIVEEIKSAAEAEAVAARILESFAAPLQVQGRKTYISGSIGIAVAGSAYRNPEYLLRDADIALAEAKRDARGRTVLFKASMRETALARHNMESNLRHALENQEFILYYQPIIDAASGRPTSYESLIRWDHPDGMIMPGDFIPLAEETGLITSIGGWVLENACAAMNGWHRSLPSGASGPGLSVNVSGLQFTPGLIDEVGRILDRTGFDPASLILEITESTVMDDFGRAAALIKKLGKMNVRVFIDDFGTGYSSMNYLHRLPVNGLKIDRSFVTALNPGNEIYEIVRSIIQLAGKLDLAVVAEGVEKQSQLDCLKELGCDLIQGYLFERPMDAARTGEYIRSRASGTADGRPAPRSSRPVGSK